MTRLDRAYLEAAARASYAYAVASVPQTPYESEARKRLEHAIWLADRAFYDLRSAKDTTQNSWWRRLLRRVLIRRK